MPFEQPKQRILESFIIIWFDPNIDESSIDFQYSINQLRRVVYSIKTFVHVDQCIDYITDIQNEKVFMIVSGMVDPQLAPLIQDIVQLYRIYVFGGDKTVQEQCIKDYHKIKGIFTTIESLCDTLKRDVHQADSNFAPISIVSKPCLIDLNQLDQSFMYSQLLKEIILKMEYDEKSKTEFIEFCLIQQVDNESAIHVIDEFERDYDRPSPVWWYTRDCFIYSMLNKALRTHDIDIILKMGFFIRDLHRQIEHLHLNSIERNSFPVYRGQGMSEAEFEKLRKSVGGLLSFNNFLSTSIDREVSFTFADSNREDPALIGVLFQIEGEPSISTAPFASLNHVGYFPDTEEEILFSMHTVFRIGEMKQIGNRFWEVKLTLTSNNDEELKRLTDYMRKETEGLPNWAQLSILMLNMGELNKAEELAHTKSESASGDSLGTDLLFHYIIGDIIGKKRDQDTSLSHLQKVLETSQKYLPADHPALAELYTNMGANYRVAGNYSTALSYNKRALEIMQKSLPPNHLNLSGIHVSIGAVYRSMANYSTALTHLEKALEIRQKALPPNHPDIARSHYHLGELHKSMGEYSTALTHLEKTLEIQQKSLPSDHPELGATHSNIGTIYQLVRQFSTALTHLKKALEIQQKSLAPNHPDLATSYNDIGVLYQSMGDRSKSLTYFKQALEIRQKSLSPNHPDLAKSHNNIGLVHWLIGDHSTALSYHKKALEIRQNSLPPNHPDLAVSLNNIGLVYRSMRKYSTAFLYLKDALEIRKTSLPSNHPDLAMAHSNIALVCQSLDRYEEAIQYASKAVDIATRTSGSSHPTMQMYRNHLEELLHRK